MIDKITDATKNGKLKWSKVATDSYGAFIDGFSLALLVGFHTSTLSVRKDKNEIINETLFNCGGLVGEVTKESVKEEFLRVLEGLGEKWVDAYSDWLMCSPPVMSLRVTINKKLSRQKAMSVVGAIELAAKGTIIGEGFEKYPKILIADDTTTIYMSTDLTKSLRDDVGDAFPEFFTEARKYIKDGVYHQGVEKWLGLAEVSDVAVRFEVKV